MPAVPSRPRNAISGLNRAIVHVAPQRGDALLPAAVLLLAVTASASAEIPRPAQRPHDLILDAPGKQMYVVRSAHDEHNLAPLIVETLQAQGLDASFGELEDAPPEVDFVLTYAAYWMWIYETSSRCFASKYATPHIASCTTWR